MPKKKINLSTTKIIGIWTAITVDLWINLGRIKLYNSSLSNPHVQFTSPLEQVIFDIFQFCVRSVTSDSL